MGNPHTREEHEKIVRDLERKNMQLEMEMKLSRKLRERANNRNADEQLNGSDKEDSDEQSDSDISETGSNISMENRPQDLQRKSTGGLMPRKQLAFRRGSFHKRVRETSGDSGPAMKKLTMIYGRIYHFYVINKFHLCPGIKTQNDEKRLKLNDIGEVRVSSGGKAPRKQLACRAGDFHKRVRETSGNPSSDSGARMKCFFVHQSKILRSKLTKKYQYFYLRSEKRTDSQGESKTPNGGKGPRKQLATRPALHSFHEKARQMNKSPNKATQSLTSGLG